MKRIANSEGISFLDDKEQPVASLTEEKKDDNTWMIQLKGNITNECAADIADELFALISTDNGIILDMGETQYVSGSFADLLVQLQIRMEKTGFDSMPIRNMPEEIFNSLKEYGCIYSLDYELKERD